MTKHPRLLMVAVAALLPVSLALAANARPAPLESATLQAPATGLPAPASDATLIDAAATKYQLGSTDLGVVSKTAVRMPVTGVSLVRAKVMDRSTNLSYGITLNAAGESVSYASARRAESRAYRAEFGTASPELVRILAASSANQRIPLGFWLKSNHNSVVSRAGVHPGVTSAQAAAVESRNLDRLADAVRPVNRSFSAFLSSRGYRVVSAARFSPAVFAVVPAKAVTRLSLDRRVQATYFAGGRAQDAQNIAKTTTAATKVWAKGITGADPSSPNGLANVGVVECCDSLFEENTADNDAENNYYLARIREGRAAACGGDHSHPTAVSGIIGSTHPQFTGIASNANIYFNSPANCGGNEAETVTARRTCPRTCPARRTTATGSSPAPRLPAPGSRWQGRSRVPWTTWSAAAPTPSTSRPATTATAPVWEPPQPPGTSSASAPSTT